MVLAFYCTNAVAQELAESQSKYMVFFTDKAGVEFDPFTYFDVKTIERRVKFGIPLDDITDYPVKPEYINTVSQIADGITHASRWFNSLTVIATQAEINRIQGLPFVKEVEELQLQGVLTSSDGDSFNRMITNSEKEMLDGQTTIMGLKEFHDAGFDGKGVRVAIFDAGFPTVDNNPAFQHIRDGNRVILTHDFVKNKDNVYRANVHGTLVMSCIGGKLGDTLIGLATGAEFLLARTENAVFEPYSEEENWLAAVEWADKNGADIINSSLGYTKQRYFPREMDGKTSLVSRAGNLAAKKGILVVNAAGNEGSSKWKYIGTPADADSVLSVGGIDHDTHYHTSFSSYGPTSDGRMKPNVCAYGHVIASGKNGLTKTQGTSFSSPLVAGFAACALQTNKNLSNMELFHEIEKSGNLYPYYDYAHGFGVPQAAYFLEQKKEKEPTFIIEENGDIITVLIEDAYLPSTDEDNEETNPLLFYSFEGENGKLEKYYVISVNQKDVLEFKKYDFRPGKKLNVSFKGYTNTYEF